jgi:hypothetical protein
VRKILILIPWQALTDGRILRRTPILVLLATLGSAPSAGFATAAPAASSEAVDLFTVSGIKVDATAQSPRAARDLAMAQGRLQAWTNLFRRFTAKDDGPNQPQLSDNQLIALIRSIEVGSIRHSTTRYLADVTIHFNPDAVQHLLRDADRASEPLDLMGAANEASNGVTDKNESTHLVADIQFASPDDWATIRAQLAAVKAISDINVVGLTLHEAQIDLTYFGQIEQLRYAMAQQNLDLSVGGDEYTLELSRGRTTAAAQ